jgi:hypothetical protein
MPTVSKTRSRSASREHIVLDAAERLDLYLPCVQQSVEVVSYNSGVRFDMTAQPAKPKLGNAISKRLEFEPF